MKGFWNGFVNRSPVWSVLKRVSVVDFTESVFRNPLKTAVQQIFVRHWLSVFLKAFVLFQTVDIIFSTKPWSKLVKFWGSQNSTKLQMSMGHIKCATENGEQLFLNTSLIVILLYPWKVKQQDSKLKICFFHTVVLWLLIQLGVVLGSCWLLYCLCFLKMLKLLRTLKIWVS